MKFPSDSFKTGFLPIQFFIFPFCKIEDSWSNVKTESVLFLIRIHLTATVRGVQWLLHATFLIQRSVPRNHSHPHHLCLNHDSSSSLQSSNHHLVLNYPSKLGQSKYSQSSCSAFWDTLCTCGAAYLPIVLGGPVWMLPVAPVNCTHCFEASRYCLGSQFRVSTFLQSERKSIEITNKLILWRTTKDWMRDTECSVRAWNCS